MKIQVTDQGIRYESEYLSSSLDSDQLVYEVIRIIDGFPLFIEDHFVRLQKSMAIQGIGFKMEYPEFRKKITKLVKLNQIPDGNIKFVYSVAEDEPHWLFTFIPHSYPTPENYRNGVPTNLYFAERENPNAKVIQNLVREGANRLIAEQKLYEVLLVDSNKMITEGSRSNVFFVKGDVFYTAPESQVLVGVTRLKVLECLKELNFQVVEKAVGADEISQFDAAFLTGTSPKVLPIRFIGKLEFNTQLPVVKEMMNYYDSMIVSYLKTH
jgi:branched-chain amino acid aminotransferase